MHVVGSACTRSARPFRRGTDAETDASYNALMVEPPGGWDLHLQAGGPETVDGTGAGNGLDSV